MALQHYMEKIGDRSKRKEVIDYYMQMESSKLMDMISRMAISRYDLAVFLVDHMDDEDVESMDFKGK
jgi:hypothetical protein